MSTEQEEKVDVENPDAQNVETEAVDTENTDVENVDGEQVEQSPDAGDTPKTPEFQDLNAENTDDTKKMEISRFHDVQVTVSAELGRTNVPIQKLLTLSEGSVFELNRSISAPVELIAQGVPFGNGEVVVVDDTFAIRIKEIYSSS